jgi:hypothetical protein
MKAKQVAAVSMAVLMATLSCVWFVSAAEETIIVPIETPPEGETMPVAVFFSDNMVFAPQWRVGNNVRVETMVLDLTGLMTQDSPPRWIPSSEVNMYTQAELFDEPGLIVNTRMVSVSYIAFTITNSSGGIVLNTYAEWDASTGDRTYDDGIASREINQVGHLIYGFLWDTAKASEDVYTVHVSLDPAYAIQYAIGHYYIGDGILFSDEYPYVALASDPDDPLYIDYKIGLGGVENGAAWIELGQLIAQGTSGGSGNGGHNGNGGHKR